MAETTDNTHEDEAGEASGLADIRMVAEAIAETEAKETKPAEEPVAAQSGFGSVAAAQLVANPDAGPAPSASTSASVSAAVATTPRNPSGPAPVMTEQKSGFGTGAVAAIALVFGLGGLGIGRLTANPAASDPVPGTKVAQAGSSAAAPPSGAKVNAGAAPDTADQPAPNGAAAGGASDEPAGQDDGDNDDSASANPSEGAQVAAAGVSGSATHRTGAGGSGHSEGSSPSGAGDDGTAPGAPATANPFGDEPIPSPTKSSAAAGSTKSSGTSKSTSKPSEPVKVNKKVYTSDCLLDPTAPGCEDPAEKRRREEAEAAAKEKKVVSNLPETLSRTQVRQGFASAKSNAKSCGTKHNVIKATSVRVKVTISGKTGGVVSATPTGEHASTPVGKCVAKALKDAKFDRFKKDVMGVTFPVTL